MPVRFDAVLMASTPVIPRLHSPLLAVVRTTNFFLSASLSFFRNSRTALLGRQGRDGGQVVGLEGVARLAPMPVLLVRGP